MRQPVRNNTKEKEGIIFFRVAGDDDKKEKATHIMEAVSFMEQLTQSLAPDLPVRLLQENARFAVYVGLWSTWWLNDANRAAKVVLVTVLKPLPEEGSNAVPPVPVPPGPLPLGDLVPWVIVQLQSVDDENPAWAAIRRALDAEFAAKEAELSSATTRKRGPNQYDPSQNTLSTRAVTQPAQLASLQLEQQDTDDATQVPRPAALLDRQRVPYTIANVANVRVFIEKNTTKQPLQQQMEKGAGLVRTGTHGPITINDEMACPSGAGGGERVEDVVRGRRAAVNITRSAQTTR